MCRGVRQPGYVRMNKALADTVEYGRQAPTNTTSHSNAAHMDLSYTHGMWAAALEQWDLCMLSVVHLSSVGALCLQLMSA